MNISQLLEALKNPQMSLTIGEKLLVGFSVAILSMAVVFLVLVAIAGIISLLQKNSEDKESSQANSPLNIKEENNIIPQSQDMGELVSIITAAICSATGNSSNNIVVRRIVRSNNVKSSWESVRKKL